MRLRPHYRVPEYPVTFSCNNLDIDFQILRWPLMSRIEHKYCLISTLYLAGLFDIFISLHIHVDRIECMCFGDFLPMRTLCDAYHEEFESH